MEKDLTTVLTQIARTLDRKALHYEQSTYDMKPEDPNLVVNLANKAALRGVSRAIVEALRPEQEPEPGLAWAGCFVGSSKLRWTQMEKVEDWRPIHWLPINTAPVDSVTPMFLWGRVWDSLGDPDYTNMHKWGLERACVLSMTRVAQTLPLGREFLITETYLSGDNAIVWPSHWAPVLAPKMS